MPKSQNDPVSEEERLVRLFWFTSIKDRVPSLIGIRPRNSESEGISLYRVECLNCPLEALEAIAADKRDFYALVSWPVTAILSQGWSVKIDHDKVPGHVLIPDINYLAWSEDKENFRARLQSLVTDASHEVIRLPVRRDFG